MKLSLPGKLGNGTGQYYDEYGYSNRYNLPIHPEFGTPVKAIHNQDAIEHMNEYERVTNSNLKIMQVHSQ